MTAVQPSMNKGQMGALALAERRTPPPVPGGHWVGRFGPQVQRDRVTAVVPAPAAIDAGLNPQPVNAGRFAHTKFTAELKVVPPAGAAENV